MRKKSPHSSHRSLRLLCLFAAIALASCSKSPPASPAEKTLRISQRNDPADLDPATATLPDEFFIIRALGEGLVTPAPSDLSTLNPQLSTPATLNSQLISPAAATHWEISADQLTYTFHLRRDALWSNGDPVTAHDFLASYRRALTPATAAPKVSLFFAVKNARAFATGALTDFSAVGFAAPDSHTLVITLEHPTPRFLLYVASGPWIPVHVPTIERHGRAWTQPAHHVGNGPFTLAEWRPHQRLVVSKNPRHHAAADIHLDRLAFISFDSGDSEERAFRAGQIDVTMSLPVSKVPVYEQNRSPELHRAPLAETRYLSLNTTRPPLNDPRVRRALSLALDRATLVARVLRGGEHPTTTLVHPSLYSPPAPADLPATPSLSPTENPRALLASAGFSDPATFPRLELSTWTNSPIVEAIQSMWRTELGIETSIVLREAKVHLAALQSADYDIAFITAIPDVPDAANLLETFRSDSAANYPHWSDSRFDELLARAARTPDLADQTALLREAEAHLLAESPLIPLYFNARNWLMSPRVLHWQTDLLWTRFYHHVALAP
jgi:ABC-type oligopeptide transport system, periplasmic component